MDAKVWPPSLSPVEDSVSAATICLPISLSRDLSDLVKAVQGLCQKQERLETRLDMLFTGINPRLENRLDSLLSSILECLNKNLDGGARDKLGPGSISSQIAQEQARRSSSVPPLRELSSSPTSTEYVPTPRSRSTPRDTPRVELNFSKPVFQHMSPLLNSEKFAMPVEDLQGQIAMHSCNAVNITLDPGPVEVHECLGTTEADTDRLMTLPPMLHADNGHGAELAKLAATVHGKHALPDHDKFLLSEQAIESNPDLAIASVKFGTDGEIDANQKAAEIVAEMNNLKKTRGMPRTRASVAPGPEVKAVSGVPDAIGILGLILLHPAFDSLCAFMILANSLLIGVITEWLTNHAAEALWMSACSHFCSFFFFIELCMRMSFQGRMYFLCDDQLWNVFDFSLVVFSLFDVIMELTQQEGSSSVGSVMKIIKMLRIVRIFRVFRFFRELALLALMIADSIRSLLWALVTLFIIMYVFAICLISQATDYLKDDSSLDKSAAVHVRSRFGNMGRALDSLIQSMLGGVSWGEISEPLMNSGWVSGTLFFFYIFFTMLAVLNIITGVFVDNAVETAKTQREFLVQKEMELKEKYLGEMRDLFIQMDQDGSGSLTIDEIQEQFTDIRMRTYFQVLGMDPDDVERLFKLIDQDASGEVEVQEFLDGCLRLKGEARSIDLHTVMYDCKACLHRVNALIEHLHVSEDALRKANVSAPMLGSSTPSALVAQTLENDGRHSESLAGRAMVSRASAGTTASRSSWPSWPKRSSSSRSISRKAVQRTIS